MSPTSPNQVTERRWSRWWSYEHHSTRRYRLAFALLFVANGAILGFLLGRYGR
jgi:hypothetical protein